MENPSKKAKDHKWIVCMSKKIPGQKYLFNTATGESKWLDKNSENNSDNLTNERRMNCVKLRTPAQDRLKRLQVDMKKQAQKKFPTRKLESNDTTKLKEPLTETPVVVVVGDEKVKEVSIVRNKERGLKRKSDIDMGLRKKLKKSGDLKTTIQNALHNIKNFGAGLRSNVVKKVEGLCEFLQKSQVIRKQDNDTKNMEILKSNSPLKKNTERIPLKKGKANQRLEELRLKLHTEYKEKKFPEIVNEEAMDWEPMEGTESNIEKIRSNNYSKKRINENVMNFTNQSHSKHINKWQKDFYYIIADTNIWLDNLTFLDEISQMKLLDTKGSVLYIPYIVIKELDGLKCRENLELRARRAINYIYDRLKSQNRHIQTQSAIEDKNHLISVDCADDAIINCCLQVKSQINQSLLLSDDTNVRNKAECNGIIVSTKSDLLSCH